MSDFPLPRIKEFVRTVVPFDALGEEELNAIVSKMEIAFFPRGEVIIQAGGEPAKDLHIIHSGSVKISVHEDTGSEILVDLRGEGDVFGAVSLLHGSRALFDVTAREDLIVFLLPGRHFRELVNQNPDFQRHFSFSLARNLQAVRRSHDPRQPAITGSESLGLETVLKRSLVSELMTTDVLSCLPHTPVREAAKRMSTRRVGSMVVQEETGVPVGIVTDTDLRARVLAAGQDPSTPVAEIMSRPVRSIHTKAFAFEAMLEMIRHRVHHLVVVQGERMVGVISDHDVRVVTGAAPVGVMRDLDKLKHVDELDLVHQAIDPVMEMLLRLGGSAEYMLELVAEFNDRLTEKILELTELEMEAEGRGRAPVPFSWLALGSAGRREQALRTPQNNGLVFATAPAERLPTVKSWFLTLGQRVVERLERCGFPLSQQGLLASSPSWCMSEAQWQGLFLEMISGCDLCVLPTAGALFDLHGVHEEMAFAESLRLYVSQAVEANRLFLARLARVTPYSRPPLGFLREFVVDKSGKYQDRLDLKASALLPIVDGARVLALEQGLSVTSTLSRLAEVARRGILKDRFASDLREAYSFIVLLRVSRHLEARAAGREPHGYVTPASLNKVQRKMLKDSFNVISQFQDFLEQRFRALMVA